MSLIAILLLSIDVIAKINIPVSAEKEELCKEIYKKMTNEHFFNDKDLSFINSEIFDSIVDQLDSQKVYFTENEIKLYKRKFSKFDNPTSYQKKYLNPPLCSIDLKSKFAFINLYFNRLTEATNYQLREVAKKNFDFTKEEFITIDYDQKKWLKTKFQLKKAWRSLAKNDVLTSMLADKKLDDMFSNNKKIDNVEVIADGRSEQKATTVDVYIKYADGERVKFERSIKSGKVKQFGQAPMGGALRQKEKDDATYSRDDRWFYQEQFWGNVGVDISAAEDDFMDTPELGDAFFASFKEAAIQIDKGLVGDTKERIMLRNLFRLAQDFAGAKIVHVYKGGYRVMDFKKLDKEVEKRNFRADLVGKQYPRLVVKDVTVEGNKGIFMEIQVKTDGNKALFEIDMGPLMKELTTVDKGKN